jgi:hypothetical protein
MDADFKLLNKCSTVP